MTHMDSSNLKAEDYDPSMFRRLLDINLTGSFIVSQAAAKSMIKTGKGGSIVFLSSQFSKLPSHGLAETSCRHCGLSSLAPPVSA